MKVKVVVRVFLAYINSDSIIIITHFVRTIIMCRYVHTVNIVSKFVPLCTNDRLKAAFCVINGLTVNCLSSFHAHI